MTYRLTTEVQRDLLIRSGMRAEAVPAVYEDAARLLRLLDAPPEPRTKRVPARSETVRCEICAGLTANPQSLYVKVKNRVEVWGVCPKDFAANAKRDEQKALRKAKIELARQPRRTSKKALKTVKLHK